jgi:hypothetical protein
MHKALKAHSKSTFQSFFKRRKILESCPESCVQHTLALTHDTGHLIPELTSFEEKAETKMFGRNNYINRKKICTVF